LSALDQFAVRLALSEDVLCNTPVEPEEVEVDSDESTAESKDCWALTAVLLPEVEVAVPELVVVLVPACAIELYKPAAS